MELRLSDLGGMVYLDELFLHLPGGCQQFLIHGKPDGYEAG